MSAMLRGRSNEIERTAVGQWHERDAGALFERARRIDDDDGALAVAGELRWRVWPLRQLGLRQANDGAAEIRIDGAERVDHVLGKRQRNRP